MSRRHQSVTGFPPQAAGSEVSHGGRNRVDILRRAEMRDFVTWLMDAGRPLALVSAQLLYMVQPLVGRKAAQLARFLESEGAPSDPVQHIHLGKGG